jgi:hypothetical protein
MAAVMDSMLFGWRGAVVALLVLAGIYLAVTLWRLRRLGKRRHSEPRPAPQAPSLRDPDSLIDLSTRLPPGFFEPGAAAHAEPDDTRSRTAAAPLEARFAAQGATGWARGETAEPARHATPGGQPRHDGGDDFARSLHQRSIDAELQQLRRESATLREEVAQLREELAAIRAARNVSPLYSEAMAMAQSGASADGIAGQCGISLAEAQLLTALARGETEDDALSTGEEINDGYPITGPRTGTHG